MLTNLEEMGKVKCHKYWPGAANTESYGEIEVKHEEEVELTEYTIRTFSLVKVCVKGTVCVKFSLFSNNSDS